MSPDAVRLATEADNAALIELERACPQGSRLIINSEREDYFIRARLFGNHHTLVAVDRQQDRIFGVIAAARKQVIIAGEARPAVTFYDLRVHPDYRRTVLGRHMLGAWLMMERWAKDDGAHLIYGLVKSDNTAMLGFQGKKDVYRWVGGMSVISRPVFRRSGLRSAPQEVGPDDPAFVEGVWREYGSRDFFPAALRQTLATPEMRSLGLFSFWRLEREGSRAALGIFRASRVMRTRVRRIPWHYRVMGPIFSALDAVLPLPRIPRVGGTIGYTFVFDHLAEGPCGMELWHQLLAHANDIALADGATLLTAAFDPSDRFRAPFACGALNRIDYRLGMRALVPGVPERIAGFCPDARDMN